MNIGIVGAGIIGRLLAWRLVKNGHTVACHEQCAFDDVTTCSQLAAGLLSPLAESIRLPDHLVEDGLQSLQLWPRIIKTLPKPVYFQQQGSLLLAQAAHRSECLNWQMRAHNRVHALKLQSAQRFHQGFNLNWQGFYLPDEGQVCARSLLAALQAFLASADAAVLYPQNRVYTIEAQRLQTHRGTFDYDRVIDCRGLAAQCDMPSLFGIRGEYLVIHAPKVKLRTPAYLHHPRTTLYCAPRPGGHIIIGASEITSEQTVNITVQTILELLTSVYALHPGFANATWVESRTGTRPTFSDNHPRFTVHNGIIRVNGLSRYGFLLGPAMTQAVVAHLENPHQPSHYNAPSTNPQAAEFSHANHCQ